MSLLVTHVSDFPACSVRILKPDFLENWRLEKVHFPPRIPQSLIRDLTNNARRQRQRSRRLKMLFHLRYFAIILTRSTSTQTTNYPGTKLVGVAFKLRTENEKIHRRVHVLNKTFNMVIPRCCFAEDGKEMY